MILALDVLMLCLKMSVATIKENVKPSKSMKQGSDWRSWQDICYVYPMSQLYHHNLITIPRLQYYPDNR
jgi:hypothetical protein